MWRTFWMSTRRPTLRYIKGLNLQYLTAFSLSRSTIHSVDVDQVFLINENKHLNFWSSQHTLPHNHSHRIVVEQYTLSRSCEESLGWWLLYSRYFSNWMANKLSGKNDEDSQSSWWLEWQTNRATVYELFRMNYYGTLRMPPCLDADTERRNISCFTSGGCYGNPSLGQIPWSGGFCQLQ